MWLSLAGLLIELPEHDEVAEASIDNLQKGNNRSHFSAFEPQVLKIEHHFIVNTRLKVSRSHASPPKPAITASFCEKVKIIGMNLCRSFGIKYHEQ